MILMIFRDKRTAIRAMVLYGLLILAPTLYAAFSSQGQAPVSPQPRSMNDTVSEVMANFEWVWSIFRFVGGIIGMVGLYGWYKASIHSKNLETAKETAEIHERATKALELEKLDLQRKIDLGTVQILSQEATISELKSRTDLTEVLKMLGTFITNSEHRYTEGMSMVRSSFERMTAESGKLTTILSEQQVNFQNLSRRFGDSEKCLDAICKHLDIPRHHSAGDEYDPSKPDRRKHSRQVKTESLT